MPACDPNVGHRCGAVVAIHTEGLYRSGDLDIIPDDFDRDRLTDVLAEIGFVPGKSRYYKHPECGHLFLEFPRGPVEIGDEYPVTPDEIVVEGRTIRLLSPTDSVKDKLAVIFLGMVAKICSMQ